LRDRWLAHERLRVSEARSINRAEVLTAHTSAEVAEVAAAKAAAAEAAAMQAAASAEAAAAAGAAAKAAADALGAQTALAPDADGMSEDAEEIPGRPMLRVGGRKEL
jgi:hypothetical protein